MKTTLLITDVTRMGGQRVCVAGVKKDGTCIRPVLPHGINEHLLYQSGLAVVRPFAKITLELTEYLPQPPHTEDWEYEPDSLRFEGMLEYSKREKLLDWIIDPSVSSIFGAQIYSDFGFYLREGEGTRSLGTIKPLQIELFDHNCDYGPWDYRLYFTDEEGCQYRLKITDLSLNYYVNYLREKKHLNCEQISQQLTREFQESKVYLRIGLTRPTWPKHPHCCALQITGVYSFPDYLERRCFADFTE